MWTDISSPLIAYFIHFVQRTHKKHHAVIICDTNLEFVIGLGTVYFLSQTRQQVLQ
jgi:ubiquinone biosynthesis protein Coq4